MGTLDVQGIVNAKGEPLVQFRQVEDDGSVIARWQTPVMEARQMAQQIVEAAANAVYDAALVSWARKHWPENADEMVANLLTAVREHRADIWGLPDQPEDWRD